MEEWPEEVQKGGEVLRFPYKPPPETVARVAEFLALATSLNAPDPTQRARVTQDLAAVRREIGRLNAELAILEAHDRELREAAAAAVPAFRRANALTLQLAIELPASLWHTVVQSMRCAPGQPLLLSQLWEEALAEMRRSYGSEGRIPGSDCFWAESGINRTPGP